MACVSKRRGRYVVDFCDNQGKRRWKTLPKGTTKKKAREVLRAIEDQLSKGTYLTDKRIPTFKEVAENWLIYKKPNVQASTWSVYEGHVRNHFDDIADLKVNRITVAKVERYISDRQDKSMNLGTLRKIMISFGQIMDYAVRHKYIDHNPVREIERPRGNGNIDTIKIRVLNPHEIKRLLEAVEDLRQGENIKYIQTQLGHSSPSVTLDVYAHLLKPYNQQAARRLEETIFA